MFAMLSNSVDYSKTAVLISQRWQQFIEKVISKSENYIFLFLTPIDGSNIYFSTSFFLNWNQPKIHGVSRFTDAQKRVGESKSWLFNSRRFSFRSQCQWCMTISLGLHSRLIEFFGRKKQRDTLATAHILEIRAQKLMTGEIKDTCQWQRKAHRIRLVVIVIVWSPSTTIEYASCLSIPYSIFPGFEK